MIGEFLALAVKNIRHRKRRSWLTIIGIFIGVAAVVALVSLGQGLQQSVDREFQRIGADKVFVQPGQGFGGGPGGGSAATLTDDDLRVVESTIGVEKAAGILMRSTRVTVGRESGFAQVVGMPTETGSSLIKTSLNIEAEEGRFIRSTDRSNVIVGSEAVDSFERDIGLRSKVEIEGKGFRVVGILEPSGDPAIDMSFIMPIDEARELLDTDSRTETFDQIVAQTQPGITVDELKADIERELRNDRGVDEGEEDFTVSTAQDLVDSVSGILGLINAVVVGIASISLLVGGVGIMNTIYTAVTERTREIDVMKAIGARNSHIMTLFLIESGMLGFIGGLVGVGVGVGLAQIGARFARQASSLNLVASMSPTLIVGSLLFAFIAGAISGIMPARKAAKMNPADALRYE